MEKISADKTLVDKEVLSQKLKLDNLKVNIQAAQEEIRDVKATRTEALDDLKEAQLGLEVDTDLSEKQEEKLEETSLQAQEVQRERDAFITPKFRSIESSTQRSIIELEKLMTLKHELKTAHEENAANIKLQTMQTKSSEALVHKLRGTVESISIEPIRIQESVNSLVEVYENLERKKKQAEAQISELAEAQAVEETFIEETKHNCQKLQTQRKGHAISLESQEVTKCKIHKDLRKLQSKIIELKTEKAASQLRARNLKIDLRSAAKEHKKLKGTLEENRTALIQLSKKEKQLQFRIEVQERKKKDQVNASKLLVIEEEELRTSLLKKKQELERILVQNVKSVRINKELATKVTTQLVKNNALEGKLSAWKIEQIKQSRQLSQLNTKLRLIERDVANMWESLGKANSEVNMKELTILDFSKKLAQKKTLVDHFGRLYDMIKSERNKYVNHIALCQQNLCELRERIKIVDTEISILTTSTENKEAVTHKLRVKFGILKTRRDSVRIDINKEVLSMIQLKAMLHNTFSTSISLKSSLKKVKGSTEKTKDGIQLTLKGRNRLGINIVKINDEICLFNEQIAEEIGKKRVLEVELNKTETEIRVLKLNISENTRKVVLMNNSQSKVPILEKKLETYKAENNRSLALYNNLCSRLENPSFIRINRNIGKPKMLEYDLNLDTLRMKLEIVRERFRKKSTQLLDVKLQLKEVKNELLNFNANLENLKSGLKELKRELNICIREYKKLTDSVLAEIAEISMQECINLALQKKIELFEVQVEKMQTRVLRGKSPKRSAKYILEKLKGALCDKENQKYHMSNQNKRVKGYILEQDHGPTTMFFGENGQFDSGKPPTNLKFFERK
eukprot:snap_masked-scaffold_2-processed-gene-6.9-mRNA-1 protein AED:1.00 eAED:1.00 QI:0/-1/0/0/-1/1/1/0/853